MPDRAEIEAATQAIHDTVRTYPDASCARMARAALAAADRVRDARGDDEAGIVEVHLSDCCHWPAMHPAGGDGYPGSPCWTVCEKCGQDCEPVPFACVAARPPQGESDEGGDQ